MGLWTGKGKGEYPIFQLEHDTGEHRILRDL